MAAAGPAQRPAPPDARRRRWGLANRRSEFVVGSSVLVLAALMVLAGASLLPRSPASSSGDPGSLSPAAGPLISVTPQQGPEGSPFSVTGSGFTADSGANVTFNVTVLEPTGCTDGSYTSTTITTDSSGAFACSFSVPSISPGLYNVTGNDSATMTSTSPVGFTVTLLEIAVTPVQGPVGSSFMVVGSGFTESSGANVTFGTTALTPTGCSAGTFSGTTISTNSTGAFNCTFSVPSDSSASYGVVGTDYATLNLTNVVSFTVTSVAISVTPGQGPVGSTTKVSGTGFSVSMPLASLVFDDLTITGSSCSSGSLTTSSSGAFSCSFSVPSETSGTTVNATDVGGQYATASFTVTVPTITVTPHQGAVGNTFTVTGSGFTVSSEANVAFGSTVLIATACSVGSFSSTTITTNAAGAFTCTFKVPTVGSGAYNVVGTDEATATLTNKVSFTVTPLSITVTPGQGPVGSLVTVAGTGFAVSAPIASLVFDNVLISTCLDGGSLTTGSSGSFSCPFDVPTGTSGTTVTAINNGGQAAQGSFTVTTPAITVTPTQGPVGSSFTTVGTGFTVNSGATLAFNGVDLEPTACLVGHASETTVTTNSTGAFSCTFTVPSVGHGNYNLIASDVETSLSTNPVSFSVTRPSITVTPAQGPEGSTVTVNGTGFSVATSLASLVFDGVTVTGCSSGSLSTDSSGNFTCTFTVPSGTSGTTITATDAGGQTAVASFTATLPAITVAPGQGPVGATVTVDGTGFSVSTSVASLTFDSVLVSACASGSLVSNGYGAFSCTFKIPGGTSGTTVTSLDAGGQSATTSFTVTIPQISETPAQGLVGDPVTVSGTGFSLSTTLASLVFDSIAISSCPGGGSLATSSTGTFSCSFTTPAGTSGSTIIATDAGGTNATETFVVLTPAVTISPAQGTVGSSVSLTGTGFNDVAAYSVLWNNVTKLCSGTTDANGGFHCSYKVPSSTAGAQPITVVQGPASFDTSFSVVPSFTFSVANGTVGNTVTVSGVGFDADMPYTVSWNATVVLCTGTTNSIGEFTCTFAIPHAPPGKYSITTSEGGYAPKATFSVVASPTPTPSPSTSTVFPWWIVGVIAIAILVLLLVALAFRYRRSHRRGRPGPPRPHRGGELRPYEAAPSGTGRETLPSATAAEVTPPGGSVAETASAEPEPDIEELIGRLERMSLQMFHKTPKELGQEPSPGESKDSSSGKSTDSSSDEK